jgi:PTS system mannose-specific IIB component/fructoselysine and glucoselysine-specific PTS system IIB component
MAIVLSRVDDRLIHGQVVIGWGRPLAIDRFALVDDEVAASDLEQELYRMAVPAGTAVEFVSCPAAGSRIEAWAASPERVLVLTGSIATMAAAHDQRPALITIMNLGGIHAGPGRREYLPSVYLTAEELATLRRLAADGVEITAQDLPTTRPLHLEELAP